MWDLRVRRIGSGQKLVLLNDQTAGAAAERMRVDFVANASHELMTPLASVKGFIETLMDPAAGGDEAVRSRFLTIMADETDRMQALIRDLISLSRIEAEKYQPVENPVQLAQIIEEAVAVLRDGSNPRGRDIVLDSDADLPVVLGDAGQLLQMVNNVLANSMKYGRADTPIVVSLGTSRSGSMVRMSVRDEGEGIAPEHLSRLTERFYRVDSGRSRALGGTGLGLSLVKHIVDRHRGHLDIASTPGQGSEVTVLLPVAPDAPPGR
jgi:two-component system phosphate regulon sensor histidine kinase PhoR